MSHIILTTGGTGGHIFPALAVYDALKSMDERISVLFVGSLYGPEADLCARAGVPFQGLAVRGLLGRGLKALSAGCLMGKALCKAISLLRQEKPRLVAGFGGYASFAPMSAALLLGIPSLLHEQNALAGTSNRIMGRFVRRIAVSLPETQGFDPKKCVVCGNPVRAQVVQKAPREHFDGRHLLVFGGSQGAHALNAFMVEHLSEFQKAQITIIHQTGQRDFAWVSQAYAEHGFGSDCVRAFIHDMPEVYQWADLTLCRSGASTVAELCAARLPSVLVPFPHAIHDHQTKNARVLEEAGCARLVPENALKSQGATEILALLTDQAGLRTMSEKAWALAIPDAAQKVARLIFSLADFPENFLFV